MRRFVLCSCVAVVASTVSLATALAAPRSFTVLGVESGQSNSATIRGETEKLYSGKKLVGHDRTLCNNGAVSICKTKFFFHTGNIRVSGRSTNAANFVFSIVGGSGVYKGATGTVAVQVQSATRELETFTFS
jgi:hypothetical protein